MCACQVHGNDAVRQPPGDRATRRPLIGPKGARILYLGEENYSRKSSCTLPRTRHPSSSHSPMSAPSAAMSAPSAAKRARAPALDAAVSTVAAPGLGEPRGLLCWLTAPAWPPRGTPSACSRPLGSCPSSQGAAPGEQHRTAPHGRAPTLCPRPQGQTIPLDGSKRAYR